MQRILFLCTGNYYRSRFAEILFNHHAEARAIRWRADSRGLALHACNTGPISCHALAQLERCGIFSDTCERFPIEVCDGDFAVADRIIAVKETEHRRLVETNFAKWTNRVEYWNIHDIDCSTPEEALASLEAKVLHLLEQLGAMAA